MGRYIRIYSIHDRFLKQWHSPNIPGPPQKKMCWFEVKATSRGCAPYIIHIYIYWGTPFTPLGAPSHCFDSFALASQWKNLTQQRLRLMISHDIHPLKIWTKNTAWKWGMWTRNLIFLFGFIFQGAIFVFRGTIRLKVPLAQLLLTTTLLPSYSSVHCDPAKETCSFSCGKKSASIPAAFNFQI